MTIATKYSVSVAWRTLAKDVFQLTRETVNNPATYRLTVSAIDTNNPGANLKEIGYNIIDFWGVPYPIIGIGSTYVDVEDIFRVGRCPMSGQMALVYKSAFDGKSLYLAPDSFQHLHPMAISNIHKYDMSILWGNDPNAKKVPFTSAEFPSIDNYQTTQVDPEDATKTINYAEIYGDDPFVRCIIVNSATAKFQRQQDPQFDLVDGKLVRVWFDFNSESVNGCLIISKS
jgi:hypothetical protein